MCYVLLALQFIHGRIIYGKIINNIRNADDILTLTNNNEYLQRIINRLIGVCEEYKLKLNTQKTKYMIISKNRNGQRAEYLGSNINEDWDPSREIKIRLERARATFPKMRKMLHSYDLSLPL